MSEEREAACASFNRRKFMRRAGVTAAGVAVAAAGADTFFESSSAAGEALAVSELDPEGLHKPDPIPKKNIFKGEIVATGERQLTIESMESGTVEIELTSDAHIDREGPAPLSAYGIGDEVVALGEQQGGTIVAVGIAPMFRVIEATVNAREGSLLRTSNGKVLLTSKTLPREWGGNERRAEAQPLKNLKEGSEIVVMGMLNQKSRIMRASLLGTFAPYGLA